MQKSLFSKCGATHSGVPALIVRGMRIALFLTFACVVNLYATGYSQDSRLTLNLKKVKLSEVFDVIQQQTDYQFLYNDEAVAKAPPVSVYVENATVPQILDICFKNYPLSYRIENRTVVVLPGLVIPSFVTVPLYLPQLRFVVRGAVRDSSSGNPLAGVTVSLKGSSIGTTTDANGNYSITLEDGTGTLVFSYVGYTKREIPVNGRANINVSMSAGISALDQLVVVGYGTQKKSDLTGSITSISSKEFEHQPVTRLDEALQGRASGVMVTRAAGAPGGSVRIRIRGNNSLTGSNDPLYVVDGFVGADFNDVNADDIASVQVLKDAAATAIYGSRGANGVIIITTKTGEKGQMKLDFMTRLSSSKVVKRYPIMHAADFARIVNERGKALSADPSAYKPVFSDSQIKDFEANGGTDWQDEIFRTAFGQEYQLGLSGGSETTTFLVSANYLDQDGVIDNSDYKRYSVRTNLSSRFNDKFSFRMHFAANRNEYHNTSGTAGRGGSLGQALAWAPTTPVRDEDGNFIIKDPTSSIFQNPVALNKENDNRTNRNNLNLIGGLRYELLPGLSLDAQLGVDYTNTQLLGYSGPDITGNVPVASRNSNENILIQNTENVTYEKTFNQDHHLKITGVFETQKFTETGFYANVGGLTYPSLSYDNLSLSTSTNVGSGYSEWSLLSLLGRADYAYKDKYLLTANVRRDGSSKFKGKNKYSIFPSAAFGWRLSKEQFMQDQNFFSNLKLRASWGLTGNQGIEPYGTLSSYVTSIDNGASIFIGNGPIVSGFILGNPGNPDLKWETTAQSDVGVDMGIFNDKVAITADYFIKNTSNLLLSKPLPGYLGGYSIMSNIGKMENKGWEFSITVNAFNSGDFHWSSSANISVVKNTLKSLGEGKSSIEIDPFILQPGHSIGSFYGYKYLGTWKPKDAAQASLYGARPGDARYVDLNNDSVINPKDYVIIGNSIPHTSFGWNNTFTYKNLALNVFFQGMSGYDKMNYSYAFGMLGSTDAKEILFSDIKNRYIPGVNESSDIPAFSKTPTNSLSQSSRFLDHAGFVRLKNISLSYTITHTTLQKLKDLTLFLSAENLLTFTNYRGIDPEANSNATGGIGYNGYVSDAQSGTDQGAYPNPVVFTFGLKINF